MPRRFDTYGIAGTLEDVAVLMQQLLGIRFVEHDSSYYSGLYYLYRQAPHGSMRLYKNYDNVLGSWVREHYRDHPLILEASCLEDMEGIQRKLLSGLEGVTLLKSTTLPDKDKDSK